MIKRGYSSLLVVSLLLLTMLVGCRTLYPTETENLKASIWKELPFHNISLQLVEGDDIITYRFTSPEYIKKDPDVEINYQGEVIGSHSTVFEKPSHQEEAHIWRNIVVSKKNRRIICIDRYLKDEKTHGYIYVLQSEHKDFPTLGRFHWDVSDWRNVELLEPVLNDLRQKAIRRMFE